MSMPQLRRCRELHGNPKSACRNKNKARRYLVGKFTKALAFSLSLFNGRAAAFHFAPSDVPVNSTTNVTTVDPQNDSTPIQLTVVNSCGESIWPGIVTQNGIAPAAGGYKLTPGTSRMMFVSADWAGRIWGRTNCSFNSDGSGPSTFNGVNGHGAACLTGDCLGKLNYEFAGQVPTTLAEFTLQGGDANDQTFYDISLVDGYNLPLAIIYHPAPNTTWIPPNLTNCACIASAGYLTPSSSTSIHPSPDPAALNTNNTYPMPYEPLQTNSTIQTWCPLYLQQSPPHNKPEEEEPQEPIEPGTSPSPNSTTTTTTTTPPPTFHPCLSPCSATRDPAACCTGPYSTPETCSPTLYARRAKRVCPDAYSFAYDDRASTFVVPAGGGWEVRFCPRGRSTDILRAFGDEVRAVGAGRGLSEEGWGRIS
ncbi:thaumatin family-domain-containing protein [Chaetomium fimeti]|uniref:Thaumatin family-domain-containing protein n=1 Tax=Chaetomium fimeti TaxID=1854472 RepID=A0AAE0HLV3_9PEZI|nr:thaumatin family-domain-containing protein [Chaetomium fimeti]